MVSQDRHGEGERPHAVLGVSDGVGHASCRPGLILQVLLPGADRGCRGSGTEAGRDGLRRHDLRLGAHRRLDGPQKIVGGSWRPADLNLGPPSAPPGRRHLRVHHVGPLAPIHLGAPATGATRLQVERCITTLERSNRQPEVVLDRLLRSRRIRTGFETTLGCDEGDRHLLHPLGDADDRAGGGRQQRGL